LSILPSIISNNQNTNPSRVVLKTIQKNQEPLTNTSTMSKRMFTMTKMNPNVQIRWFIMKSLKQKLALTQKARSALPKFI